MPIRTLRPLLAGAALGAALAFGPVLPASAGLDEGISAYEAGEFATAMAELKPLADQGNPQAQYYVGRMYANGEGTLKHYSLAHTYLTLAANQGVTDALTSKAEISGNLSQRDIIDSLQRQNDMLLAQQAGVQQALDQGAAGTQQAAAQPAGEQQAGTQQNAAQQDGEEVAMAQPDAPAADDDIAEMDRNELVRAVQEQLNRLGYSAGTPDGLYGPSTRSAIQNFQRDADLSADGEATPDLLRALRASEPS